MKTYKQFHGRSFFLAGLLALLTSAMLACGSIAPEPETTPTPRPQVSSLPAVIPPPIVVDSPDSGPEPPQYRSEPSSAVAPSASEASSQGSSSRSSRSPAPAAPTVSFSDSVHSSSNAPSSSSSQGSAQQSQSGAASTAPRPVPRNIPRDTATTGPQPLVSTSLDPISTFSLDTDRASFQRALEATIEGYNIDPSDVRAEEWINALNYSYPRPSRPDEFAIHTEVFQHPDTQGMHLARVGIQAPDAEKRSPVNVTLVLDTSGSMGSEGRIEIAETAAWTILDNLRLSDRIAVVKFESHVTFVHAHSSPDSLRSNPGGVLSLWAEGGTNVQAGLDEALWLANDARHNNPDAVNYVILFSDGVANINATDPFAILHNVGQDSEYSRVNPIRIVTIGVGINGNDHLLEQVAQFGNGWYRYFDTWEQAKATFNLANWDRITNPFADQARAQIIWNPDMVSHWRIVGYENRVTPDATFTQNRREFAEIPAGTATTVFYELQLTGQVGSRNASTARLGDVEIRWVEPITGISREQYDAVAGAWREDFRQLQDPMLRLGAITGLSADIFASLDDDGYGTGGVEAPQRLTELLEEYELLQSQLGHIQAYQDVGVMLQNLEWSATGYWEQPRPVREGPGTGYSP